MMVFIKIWCVIIFVLFISCKNDEKQSGKGLSNINDRLSIVINKKIIGQSIFPIITNINGENSTFEFTSKNNRFIQNQLNLEIISKSSKNGNIIGLWLAPTGSIQLPDSGFIGLFMHSLPNFKKGVTIWRYKPWNSWTKPIAINSINEIEDWDIQFFYWQNNDSSYGAAMPMSGKGFRTTLGKYKGCFGALARANSKTNLHDSIPLLAMGIGNDPYQLINELYTTALNWMGHSENIISKKNFPEPLKYIGWCTWNASNLGRDLSSKNVIESVQSFKNHNFPLGWVLIDDGWFNHTGSMLNSFQPDTIKFPEGFGPMIKQLKANYGIKYVGVWHALDGYWNGINPESEVGEKYKSELFSWTQNERPEVEYSPLKTYWFIKPFSASLNLFYNEWHGFLKSEGFDFVKVDNQLITERMSKHNYPIDSLSSALHKALNTSVDNNFDGALINCMDMTAEAYLNFGNSAIARSVEDYFPYEHNENYNLQRGNAAVHILQAIYNALYFSRMVYPDFDMFESNNPNAEMHAVARSLNNGPIYITDKPGSQNFNLLNKMILSDGQIIRADSALRPTRDCLFQVQGPNIFKAFSFTGNTGLLSIFNCADADSVSGSFSIKDIHGLKGEKFVLFDYFKQNYSIANINSKFTCSINRMGCQVYFAVPVISGFAAIGLIEKYNSPATVKSVNYITNGVQVKLAESGNFIAYSEVKPKKIFNNEIEIQFTWNKGLLKTQGKQGIFNYELTIIY